MKILRRSYDWVLRWAGTPYAVPALFVLSFTESSFFPIPPDVLLIAMAVAVPKRAFYFAAVCSVASVLGGILGYGLGYGFMDVVGNRILAFYHFEDKFETIRLLYNQYEAWAVAAAAFTPLPYKVFTLAAGAFKINFTIFVLASAIARSARFFLVAALIYRFGPPIKEFIEKYFNILSIVFFISLVFGFYLIKVVF
ncbi:MAG: VTT domain-containing protein [Nitrospinota bacterium]|nr:VTT domain-containing protein [Nitrospinota bacterium]